MARKTQISKEVILEAAFTMLLRDGYASINIKTLANEIGCSTQPIAWHFGNMEGLRDALLEHSLIFLKDRFSTRGEHVSEILEGIASAYIELAFDYPNLYKYLYMSEHDGEKMGNLAHLLRAENQGKIVHLIGQEHGISPEAAGKYLMNLQLYVHGIASFAVTKISFPSKEVIMQMIHDANEVFLEQVKN